MPTDRKANDPCFCGSGEAYKKCHKPLHRTPPARYLNEARKFYVNRWVKNAAAHERASDYHWMLDQVPGPVQRVLDIGVGEGSGFVAMLQRYKPDRAVGIEENPECVRRALTKLTTAGVPPDVITRQETAQVEQGKREYSLSFSRGPIPAQDAVTIVVTDPLFDKHLAADLANAGPFDLLTAWLVGSHEAREHSVDLMALGHMTSARYRLLVQNACYELADKILDLGGRLQIVDRLPMQDLDRARSEAIALHTEQAEPTTLHVTDVAFREYREARAGGVKMLLKDEGQGTLVEGRDAMLLVSVVSVKR